MNDRLKTLLKELLSRNDVSDYREIRRELDSPENRGALEQLSLLRDALSRAPAMDKEKIRNEISRYRDVKHTPSIAGGILRYAAVLIVPLLLAALLYMNAHRPDSDSALTARIEHGGKHALIRIGDGEFVDISGIVGDTAIRSLDYTVKITAQGEISCEREDGVARDSGGEVANTLFVPRGGEYSLTLPDGSRVWLNSDTEFRFYMPFTGAERRVAVKGEACFEVAHDPESPFVVDAGDMSLKVLGTRFNVECYGDGHSSATLMEGSLGVSYGADGYAELRPGERLDIHDGTVAVKVVDAEMCAAWIDGLFCFDDTPLDEIARRMERWYDVTFVFADPGLRNERFTGVIKRGDRAGDAMEIFRKIIGIRYEIKDRTVYVFRAGVF